MSKRSSSSSTDKLSTKKVRHENYEDLWGDDLDGDIIDDCFKKAVSQEEHDVTLLTSYSIFKQPKNLFTSTQVSQKVANNGANSEEAVKELKAKLAEKEGEASILRANLQNLRTSFHVEQDKKYNEWKEKLSQLEKENKSVKSELEFKNLEVANLKQQISELCRLVNTESQKSKFMESKSSGVASPNKYKQQESYENFRIYINAEEYFPLKNFNFSFIFKTRVDDCNNTYEDSDSDLASIYSELSHLVSLSCDDLDSEVGVRYLSKVVNYSYHHLKKLHSSIKQTEDDINLGGAQESNELYLKNKSFNQLSQPADTCAEIITFLAESLPFSSYLSKYFLSDQPSVSSNNVVDGGGDLDTYPSQYLMLLSNLISLIGKTKTEKDFSSFLSAAIKLLSRLNDNDTYSLYPCFTKITKDVLFLQPDLDTLLQITFYIKIITRNPNFIYTICSKPDMNNKEANSSGEFCRFRMFIVSLESNLSQIEDEDLLTNIVSNVLSFIYNIFVVNNSWLYQENITCDCSSKLYKLGIRAIYKKLQSCRKDSSNIKSFCKKSIKVLNLMTFNNSYELMQKYVKGFAQFKEVVYTLKQICDEEEFENLKNLEKLSITEEDLPAVSHEKFLEVDL